MNYQQWRTRHPQAAAELMQIFAPVEEPKRKPCLSSEAGAQQAARMSIAKQGGMSWRNNVGATPARVPVGCPACGFKHELRQVPLRYGLANDSKKLNDKIKSSDLILAIPRRITADMVGSTFAQFGAVECKAPGWRFTGNGRETAQLAWLELVQKAGGYATFSTGGVQL